MNRAAKLVLAAFAVVGASWLYAGAVATLGGWALGRPIPSWWPGDAAKSVWSILGWMQLIHTTALLLASLPFAFGIVAISKTRPVLIAILVAAIPEILIRSMVMARGFAELPPRQQFIHLLDLLKALCVLPLLTWFGAGHSRTLVGADSRERAHRE